MSRENRSRAMGVVLTLLLTALGLLVSGPIGAAVCGFLALVLSLVLWTPLGPWLGFAQQAGDDGREGRREGRRAEAVRALKEQATELGSAKIVVFPAQQVPLAREVRELFELAGWSVDFFETPQEPFHGRYVEGVEVSGVSHSLLEAVARALEAAGIAGVRTVKQETGLQKGNPKRPRAFASVRVTVGHPAAALRAA